MLTASMTSIIGPEISLTVYAKNFLFGAINMVKMSIKVTMCITAMK